MVFDSLNEFADNLMVYSLKKNNTLMGVVMTALGLPHVNLERVTFWYEVVCSYSIVSLRACLFVVCDK